MKKSKDDKALTKAINSAKVVKAKCTDMRTLKEIDIADWLMGCGKDLTLMQCNYIASSLFYESIPHITLN